MSNKKLTILGIVAVLMVVWAVVQSRISNKPKAAPDTPVYLIQGLDPAGVGSIVLGTGINTVTLKRKGGGFAVADKDDYPAVTSEINNLITSCLDIQTVELYTEDPANHKDLGVTEEDARYIVKFLKPNSELLAGIVIGKAKEQGQGTFVRLVSSDKVYVASQTPWIKSQAMDYIDQDLISMEREDIESVTATSPFWEYTLKAKEESEGVVMENAPADKKLKSKDAEDVFTALTNLSFDNVMRETEDDKDWVFERRFICRLKDSTVYTIELAGRDKMICMKCKADFTDKTPVTKKKEVESEEELKKKEAKLLAAEKAEKFSAKHKGWIYEVAEHKAMNLAKKLSDLLEDEEKPEETEQVSDPNTVKTEN